MKRVDKSGTPFAQSILRIELSELVSSKTLHILHSSGLTDEIPQELRDLIRSSGGDRISGVYQLSSEEIDNDTYGFAYEFKLHLRIDVDMNSAIEALKCSPLIKSAKPIAIKKPL